jgi:uncharacterized protein (TIGR03086 family)
VQLSDLWSMFGSHIRRTLEEFTMSAMIDLVPAAQRLASVLAEIADDQLDAPTPCTKASVGDLVDHVDSFSAAFTAAAHKDSTFSRDTTADARRLGDDWRTRIPHALISLGQAWRDPAAWEGMTKAGGIDLPAQVAGHVALDEIVLHGWDIARACGLPYEPEAVELNACLELIPVMSPPEKRTGDDGLFGPAVEVPDDAPLFDRVLGLSGRDPSWAAPDHGSDR